jgi:hypothetical protein
LQGPHQGAQKSTITGWLRELWMTSWTKCWVSLSLTRSPAGLGAAPDPLNPDSNAMTIPSPLRDDGGQRWV